MGKLLVKREKRLIGSTNKVLVYLDNKVIGSVKNGETKEFNVKDTIYTAKAGTGIFSGMSNSEDIAIRDNHTVLITVSILSSKIYSLVVVVFLISTISIGILFLTKHVSVLLLLITLLILVMLIILRRNLFFIKTEIINKEK